MIVNMFFVDRFYTCKLLLMCNISQYFKFWLA